VHCSALQCIAVHCSALQCIAVHCSALQCIAVHCSALQCVAACCSVLQCALHAGRQISFVGAVSLIFYHVFSTPSLSSPSLSSLSLSSLSLSSLSRSSLSRNTRTHIHQTPVPEFHYHTSVSIFLDEIAASDNAPTNKILPMLTLYF